MMRDADAGEIDCIIVKDLSRFGRNHYECDRYMQMVFPQKGIRFIAITDHYDSNNETSETDMFLIPIKKTSKIFLHVERVHKEFYVRK